MSELRPYQPERVRRVGDLWLTAKLSPPILPVDVVTRPRLMHLLNDTDTARVFLILAPAGFGKSTVLAQWAKQREEPVAWISLDESCRDLYAFVSNVMMATQNCNHLADALLQVAAAFPAGLDVHAAYDLLSEWFSVLSDPLTIVLDDYHRVRFAAIHELIGQLIDGMTGSVRLAIASRTEPPIPLARQRVLGNVTLLTADDLRFTSSEAERFLDTALQTQVPDAARAMVLAQVDGWAAGLRMAILAISGARQADIQPLLARLGSSDQLMRDYLLEEVLSQQPPQLQQFLLETSICDRLSADLCEAITGDPDAGQHLERIQRAGLFLVSLDPTGTWYRVHHLFLDFLRARLKRTLDDAQRCALHLRACDWLARHQFVDDAIQHAIEAGDWARAADLIKPVILALGRADRASDLRTWLAELPIELLEAEPVLYFVYALAASRLGLTDEADAIITRAERLWDTQGYPVGPAIVATVRATIARVRKDGAEMTRQAELALRVQRSLDGDDDADLWPPHFAPYLWPMPNLLSTYLNYFQVGVGLRLLGRPGDAEPFLSAVYDDCVLHGNTMMAALVPAERAYVRMQQGQLVEAQTFLRSYGDSDTVIYPHVHVHVLIRLGSLQYEWNQLVDAEQSLHASETIRRRIGVRTYLPVYHTVSGRLRWACGDVSQAFAHLDLAVATGKEIGSERLVREAAAYQARFWLVQGDVERASRWAWERGVSADDEEDYARLIEHLTLARVLIVQDEAARAISLLDRLLGAAEASGRDGDAVEVRLIKAIAHQDLFELDTAVETLEQALSVAAPARYIRTFLDEGDQTKHLLRLAVRRGVMTAPIVDLLTLLGEEVTLQKVVHRDLIEPISRREIEVLQLLAVGLTNKEVADSLYISVATVKRHITNLYAKLSVTNRTEAIVRARTLEIL